MTMLQKASSAVEFATVNIMGFPGGGKTHTAALMAIGLAKEFAPGKPVAMFDTENGSNYVAPMFDAAGVELLTAKSRSFSDLLKFMTECRETGVGVVLVDSVTHPWHELIEAARRKANRTQLAIHHWGAIKLEWGPFADMLLNPFAHMICCGRAGWDFENVRDEETGKLEMIRSGSKMKAEGQFGFEPSMVLEMEPLQAAKAAMSWEGSGRYRKPQIDSEVRGMVNRCHVLKSRGTDLASRSPFDMPDYETFRPFWDLLTPGKPTGSVDTEVKSDDRFENPQNSGYAMIRERDALLEEIKNTFVQQGLDGTAKGMKQQRLDILAKHFGTSTWARIEQMDVESLTRGVSSLVASFEPPVDDADGFVSGDSEPAFEGER